MKLTKAILCVLMVCAALFACALADGTPIEGKATQTVEFTVYPQTGTTLTFTQEKGTVVSTGGIRSTIYGGFDITWYPVYQPASAQTASMTGRTARITLIRGVQYTVRVTPQALSQLKNRDAYLGLPGTYERWATPAEWSLTGSQGCQVSLTGAAVTPTPKPYYSWPTATPTPYYYWPTATPVPYYYGWPTATPTPYYYGWPTATPYYYGWPTATPTPNYYGWPTATPRNYYYGWPTATPTPNYYGWPTATPAVNVSATVNVFYRQPDGRLITYQTETLSPGTHVITSKLNGSYFTPVGETYKVITVSNYGVASPASVTFYYQYNSNGAYIPPTPTPLPTATPTPSTATVQILYKQSDGTVLSQETRLLSEGTHQIAYDNRFSGVPWLSFLGPASYNVTVGHGGAVSASTLTFYFSLRSGYNAAPVAVTPSPTPQPVYNEALTDQEAEIGAEKIFPRPMPGKGKNTFNYEAIGQKVTVHSKARSLQKDGTWWVCISANLRCWGQDYVIDHQWINVTYLRQRSFDLDKVPIDPNYQ